MARDVSDASGELGERCYAPNEATRTGTDTARQILKMMQAWEDIGGYRGSRDRQPEHQNNSSTHGTRYTGRIAKPAAHNHSGSEINTPTQSVERAQQPHSAT